MISIEEKLSVFTKLVLEKVQNEYDDKLNEINIQNDKRIKEYKLGLQRKGENIIKDMVQKGEIEKNKMIAKVKLDKKRKVLYKRQELIERLIDNMKNKALVFTDKEEYRHFLKTTIKDILLNFKSDESITLYLVKKDMKRHKLFILNEVKKYGFDDKNIEIIPFKEDMVGGIIAFNKNRTFKVDSSIYTKVEENRQLIGKQLYESLKKTGD